PTLSDPHCVQASALPTSSLTTQPTLTTTATASSHVAGNPYSITASGAVDTDYTISYLAGTLTVDPVALTITADSLHKNYGAALPTLTYTPSGLVNGDTKASLTTQPTLSTTATASSHVAGNPYSITASGAVDADYTISYLAGTLTVDPVAISHTIGNDGHAYGSTDNLASDLGATFLTGINGENLAIAYSSIGRSEEHTSELQSRSDLVCR